MKIPSKIRTLIRCSIKEPIFDKLKGKKNKVNLLYYTEKNFGDVLSPIIVEYLLNKKGLSLQSKSKNKFVFLSALGSILGYEPFLKKTIWGTGSQNGNPYSKKTRCFAKLDVRCLRGPLTEKHLLDAGILKDKIHLYGDPAVLMPIIYPCKKKKKYDVSFVPHFLENHACPLHTINLNTRDWKKVIDEIVESEYIITSSLHAIIIAESYGVPAVWLHNENSNQDEFKYLDYYYSTERFNPLKVCSIEDGLKVKPNYVPDLENLRKNLLDSFPYSLWR